MSEARWAPYRRERGALRERIKVASATEIGQLSDRELFLIGVGLYWAEASKSRPYRPSERLVFINSDPDVIALYLAWLVLLGVEKERMRFAVSIHESADVAGAERFWAEWVGVVVRELRKATLKKHTPKTVRKNVGPGCRGCLKVAVLGSADLYRRVEGWWYGIVGGAPRSGE